MRARLVRGGRANITRHRIADLIVHESPFRPGDHPNLELWIMDFESHFSRLVLILPVFCWNEVKKQSQGK